VADGALEKFSVDFLTERLRASGALPRGRVLVVDAGERRTTIVSTVAPLRVEYSSDAPAEAPPFSMSVLDRSRAMRVLDHHRT
jgi:hypothetical protein